MRKAFCVLFCFVLLFCGASAHSGRTDASGGHWDSYTGEYHYHHGYPAHQHTNGICPYEYDDKTEPSSGVSSSTIDTSYDANTQTKEYKYNDGLGDDGTYETAYNLGYQHSMESLYQNSSIYPFDITDAISYFCHTKAKTGSTMLSDVGMTYDEAYEQGYLGAQSDIQSYIDITHPEGSYAVTLDEDATEYPYDLDDGTYETAYNSGYEYGLSRLCEINSDLIPDISTLTSALYQSNRIEGNTALISREATFESAFEDGYYQSEQDLYATINNLILSTDFSQEADNIDATASDGEPADSSDGSGWMPVALMSMLLALVIFIYYKSKEDNARS